MTVKDLPEAPSSRIKLYGWRDELNNQIVLEYHYRKKHYAYCTIVGQSEREPAYLTLNTPLIKTKEGYRHDAITIAR